jgi:peptidoglycan hydrolase-like protein with peptidoglycan-binding domain
MNARLFTMTALFCLAAVSWMRADQAVASVQQKLKDQGFYYGEIHGQKDADTTAAIRRYQIRNGLQITGELDAETQRSLGVTASIPSATPRPRPANTPAPETTKAPEESRPPGAPRFPPQPPNELDNAQDERAYVPGPRDPPRLERSGIFDGTPFDVAPPEVQRRVIIGAQTLLLRRGFYQSGIDGVYGPGMNFAVRAYQAQMGFAPTGRLDLETLASLGLLPGQRRPGFGPPPRRMLPPRSRIGPGGERVYIPD